MPKKEYELFEWKVFAFKRSDVPVFLLKLVNSNYFLIQPSFRDANILHQVVSSHEFMHLRSSYPVNLHIFFFEIICNKAKRRISKQVFQENKARQIFRKTNISYPLLRKNLTCFVFLKHPFWDSLFCLITGEI